MLARSWPVQARIGLGVCAVAALGVAATFLIAPLNPNLRYEAGVKQVTGTAAGSFSHRPLAYRLLTDGVFRLARLATTDLVGFELAVRVLLALLAAGAVVLLGLALARRGVRPAGAYAAVAGGVLALFGTVSAGEPEWLAALLTIAGVGVALLGRYRPWWFAGLAGLLFVAATGMKLISLSTALLGLVAVFLIDRRQAARTVLAAVVIGLLYTGATLLWVPWEVQWLFDIRSVQNSPAAGLPDTLPYFADLAASRPVLVVLPAALVLAGARERVVVLGAVAVTTATILAQGQYFQYHAIDLVLVAALAALRAFRGRVAALVAAVVTAVVAAAAALTTINSVWLSTHQRWWGGGLLAAAVLGVVWAVIVRRRAPREPARPPAALVAAAASPALVCPGSTPWAAHLVRPEFPDGSRPPNTYQQRESGLETARQAHRLIGGRDVRVTYLTSGEWPYFLGNPTDCRYPSPLFLQRTLKPGRLGTASYAENLACLNAAGSRWLIVETHWFVISKQPAAVRAVLDRTWDCTAPAEIGELLLCPRRGPR